MMKRDVKVNKGDVLCVDSIFKGIRFQHFAVYIGENKIVHYTGRKACAGNLSKGEIKISAFEELIANKESFYICNFKNYYCKPEKMPVSIGNTNIIKGAAFGASYGMNPLEGVSILLKLISWMSKKMKEHNYTLYSPNETVERALSRVGETMYLLPVNNCEHFAIWCKTGISESKQVEEVLDKIIKTTKVPIESIVVVD